MREITTIEQCFHSIPATTTSSTYSPIRLKSCTHSSFLILISASLRNVIYVDMKVDYFKPPIASIKYS